MIMQPSLQSAMNQPPVLQQPLVRQKGRKLKKAPNKTIKHKADFYIIILVHWQQIVNQDTFL